MRCWVFSVSALFSVIMVWRLLLVCLQLASVLCEPPITCVTSPRQPRGPQSIIRGLETSGAGSVECSCGQRRSYTGNLNFVKAALSRTRPRGGGNVDVILRDCDLLRLELNFHNVAAQQPFNLRIYESDRVEINVVELSLSLLSQTRQTIVVKNVSSLHVEGRVQCRVCPENTGMLNIQVIPAVFVSLSFFGLSFVAVYKLFDCPRAKNTFLLFLKY